MDEKTSKDPAQLDNERLLQEIEQLRQALTDLHQEDRESASGRWMAVYRIFQGLDSSSWDDIATRHGLQEWLSLPLAPDTCPGLTLLQERLARLAHLTDHDPLTGLANRRALERSLNLEVERAERFKSPLSLALFDLDDFKKVNDDFGHDCGDEVLINFANTVSARIRRIDVLSRYGGEEFALLLPGTGQARSERMMSRMQQAVADMGTSCASSESPVRITCSIGVVTFRGRAPMSWQELLKIADDALYQAKRQGKNQVVMAPLADLDMAYDNTEVGHEEKKFLFAKDW